MKLAVLMDDPATLNIKKDSTLAMIKAANRRGWTCDYLTLHDLYCTNKKAFGRMRSIQIKDEAESDWAGISEKGDKPLSDYDIILMRKDPPFDMEYIYATYALELAEAEGVLVANRPQSLRDANEKYFTLNFPQCCPETLVSKDCKRLRQFWQQHQKVIFKPLEGMGGASVYLVEENAINLSVILETLSHRGTVSVMAQKYVPDIRNTGDKRILMIHGKPVPFGLARVPAEGELRGNLAAGARGKVVSLNERDYWICKQLAPSLLTKGLLFVGLDIIGDYLTEINVTSPTCLREIEKESGIDIADDYLEGLAELKKTAKLA